MGRNAKPTRKFAVQLVQTAKDAAVGRADWLKSSATRNHGMDPGPEANMMM